MIVHNVVDAYIVNIPIAYPYKHVAMGDRTIAIDTRPIYIPTGKANLSKQTPRCAATDICSARDRSRV